MTRGLNGKVVERSDESGKPSASAIGPANPAAARDFDQDRELVRLRHIIVPPRMGTGHQVVRQEALGLELPYHPGGEAPPPLVGRTEHDTEHE